jgi:hypothetical protein
MAASISVVLTSFDDYPVHQTAAPLQEPASGDRNHYDRYFFNGYDREGSLFFALAMGRYANRSVIDAAFSVVDAGVQRSVHASGRAPLDPIDTTCGPVRVEVVEPLRVLRVVVDDAEHGIGCDLTWRARTLAVEEDRFHRRNGTRIVMDYTRLTQFGTWDGWVRTGDREVTITPETFLGSRDRSWGIRSIGEPEGGAPGTSLPQFFWLWAPLNFEDGAAHFDVNETGRGERWHQTAIRVPLLPDGASALDPGGLPHSPEPMRAVDWHIDWEPGTRRAQAASLTFTPWNEEPSTIELEPMLTFQMLGIGYFHPEWSHGVWKGESATGTTELVLADLDPVAVQNVHVQQLVRARWGDRTGVGVLEQLAIGEHEPSGLSGLFDGARG